MCDFSSLSISPYGGGERAFWKNMRSFKYTRLTLQDGFFDRFGFSFWGAMFRDSCLATSNDNRNVRKTEASNAPGVIYAPIPLCRSRYDLSISSGRAGVGKMKPIWTMIFKSTWWENIKLSTAHRHEVVQVGSESGSAMSCLCYSSVPDLNTLIPLCLRHHYALPACLN